jgi:hypothetical protein
LIQTDVDQIDTADSVLSQGSVLQSHFTQFSRICRTPMASGNQRPSGRPRRGIRITVWGMGDIMNDVLGNALQKLASAETIVPVHITPTQADGQVDSSDHETSCTWVTPKRIGLPTECVTTQYMPTFEHGATDPQAETETTEIAEPTDAASSRSLKVILLQNPLPLLQAYRRKVAAAVILLCMAVIWSEESASTTPHTFDEPTAEMTSVESLLADFATIDSQKMRDPAEPINPSSHSSPAIAGNSNEGAPAAVTGSGHFLIPNSTPGTTPGFTQDAGGSTGVRFTGRIQPLK